MRIYLAGSYLRQAELYEYTSDLILLGHEAVSSWVRIIPDAADDGRRMSWQRGEAASIAETDLADISRADLVICFTEPPGGPGRGGRHFEAGFAAALGKKLWVVGPTENIFYALPRVRNFPCWTACRCELVGRIGVIEEVDRFEPVGEPIDQHLEHLFGTA